MLKTDLFRYPKSMYSQMLLTFTLILSLLVIGLSSFFYYNYTRSTVGIINGMNNKLLAQISYSMTYMNDLARNFTNSVYLANAIAPLMYAEKEDMFTITGAIHNLDAQVIRNAYVHSVYTFNRKLDMFISTETNSYYTQSSFYDQDIVGIINDLKANEKRLVPLPRVIPLKESADGTQMVNVISYLMFPPPSRAGAMVDGAIVVNVKADWLRDTIASLKSKSDSPGDIMVIDAAGRIVVNSSTDNFLALTEDSPDLMRVVRAANTNDSFVQQINGKRMIVNYVSLKDLGWQFISLTPYDSVIAPVRRAQWTTVVVCLVILLAGLWLSRIASRAIYSPLGEFLSLVREQGNKPEQETDKIGEVPFLSGVFALLRKQKDSLEQETKEQRRPLKDKFLRDLLSGSVHVQSERLAELFHRLMIRLQPDQPVWLVLLKLDGYKLFCERYKERDQALLRFGIANIAAEVATERWRMEAVEMDNDQLCLLLNAGKDCRETAGAYGVDEGRQSELSERTGSEREQLRETVQRIQEAVHRYLQLSLSAVLDESSCKLEQAGDRYKMLLHLSMNRVMYGHGCRITPQDVQSLDSDRLKIPAAKEKQLLDAIKLGNRDKANSAYMDISAAMRKTAYDHVLAYVIYLMHTIYKSVQSTVREEITFSAIFNDFFREVSYFETMDEIDDLFLCLIDDLISKMDKSKINRTEELIGHIKAIIAQQYADKNLSLNVIAERLDMSSVYLGKLFKDATGKSIADHITEVRMEQLKKLLDKDQLSTKEMLEHVGLEENSYFYTLFKKYFGVPLSEYKHRLRLERNEGQVQ